MLDGYRIQSFLIHIKSIFAGQLMIHVDSISHNGGRCYDTIFMKIHNDNSRKNRLDKPLTKKTKVAPIYPSLAVYIQYEHSMFLNEIR